MLGKRILNAVGLSRGFFVSLTFKDNGKKRWILSFQVKLLSGLFKKIRTLNLNINGKDFGFTRL
jgi:hypothetical protein